jgi:hypothetical protein
MFIPDPDLDILPIPDLGSRGQKGTGSRIRILIPGIVIRFAEKCGSVLMNICVAYVDLDKFHTGVQFVI